MSLIEGRAHIGPDGELRISLPPVLREKDVKYTLDVQPSDAKQTNGAPVASGPAGSPPRMSQEEWRRFIHQVAGSIDDPTFERPPQPIFEPRRTFE